MRSFDTWQRGGHQQRLPYVWLLIMAFWAVAFGRTAIEAIALARDPGMMCDDVRIVHFHFYHWKDAALFANDVLGKYHSDGTSELFRGLFFLVAKLGDPYEFTKLTPFLLALVAYIGIGVAAHELGGKLAVFVAITLCLGSTQILGRTAGLLPRAFAYPIIAWMAAALVYGRVRSLAALTVLGAGFYPVITVVGGLSLAILLFVTPARDRGSASAWSWRVRLGWLVGTAIVCAILTAPFTLRMRPYGRAITPDLVTEFPEAGVGGRQDSVTRPPFAPVAKAWANAAESSIIGIGPRFVPRMADLVTKRPQIRDAFLRGLSLLTVLGCLGLSGSRAVRRLAVMAAAVGIAYLLADAVTPRLVVPPRYTTYGVPIITVLAIGAAPAGLLPARWFRRKRRWVKVRRWTMAGSAALLLCFVGARGRGNVGLRRFIEGADLPLYAFIAELPKSSLIAGWPEGRVQTMPLASKRTPFLTRELHVPYHTGMTLLMRERMNALIDGFYATDPAPLRRLRDEFGVTHLLVEQRWLREPSRYFLPFGDTIERAFVQGNVAGFAVERLRQQAKVYDTDAYYLLDLSRIP